MWGGGIDWINLAQDRDGWRVLVNTVMNVRVPYNVANPHVMTGEKSSRTTTRARRKMETKMCTRCLGV
jgi:hypothetical protein